MQPKPPCLGLFCVFGAANGQERCPSGAWEHITSCFLLPLRPPPDASTPTNDLEVSLIVEACPLGVLSPRFQPHRPLVAENERAPSRRRHTRRAPITPKLAGKRYYNVSAEVYGAPGMRHLRPQSTTECREQLPPAAPTHGPQSLFPGQSRSPKPPSPSPQGSPLARWCCDGPYRA